MDDVMLIGVLRMPMRCWSTTPTDQVQRHGRYMQAANRIEDLKKALEEACAYRSALCSNSDPEPLGPPPEQWDPILMRWLKVLNGEES